MCTLGGPRPPPPPLDATGQPVVFSYGDANAKSCANKSKVELHKTLHVPILYFNFNYKLVLSECSVLITLLVTGEINYLSIIVVTLIYRLQKCLKESEVPMVTLLTLPVS